MGSMVETELADLIGMAQGWVRDRIEGGGIVPMTALAQTVSGRQIVIIAGLDAFGPHTARRREALREALRRNDATAYCFVSETWVAARTEMLPAGMRVSDLPAAERRDGALVLAVVNGQPPVCFEAIVTGPEGSPRSLGDWRRVASEGDVQVRVATGPTEW